MAWTCCTFLSWSWTSEQSPPQVTSQLQICQGDIWVCFRIGTPFTGKSFTIFPYIYINTDHLYIHITHTHIYIYIYPMTCPISGKNQLIKPVCFFWKGWSLLGLLKVVASAWSEWNPSRAGPWGARAPRWICCAPRSRRKIYPLGKSTVGPWKWPIYSGN